MEQIAFTMQLKAGQLGEYRRRHDEIWPELAALLAQAGVRDYSIFADPVHGTLFAVLRRTAGHQMETLAQHPVMQRWWTHMADLMETDAGQAPLSAPLLPMFHLD